MKQLLLTFLITCFIYGPRLCAQEVISNQEEAEQKLKAIRGREPGISKINIQLALADWFIKGPEIPSVNIDTANRISLDAYQSSKKQYYIPGEAKSSLQLSLIAQINHNYELGKTFALTAVDLFTKLEDHNNLGEAYVLLWSNSLLAGLLPEARIPILEKAATSFILALNDKRTADCYKELGDLYYLNNELPKSLEVLQKSLELYKKVKYPRLMGVYDLLGVVFFKLGDYQNGVQFGLKAIQTAEALGDTSVSMCTYYNRVGAAYLQMSDTANSRLFFGKALDIAVKYDDQSAIGNLTFNIAEQLIRFGQSGKALDLLQSTIKRYPYIDAHFKVPISLLSINAYRNMAAYEKVVPFLAFIETQAARDDMPVEVLKIIYSTIIPYFVETHQDQKASSYATLLKAVVAKLNSPDINADYHLLQFKVDSATGKYISAIENLQRYKDIRDSLLTETKSRQIAQFSVLYETEKKEKNIQSLQRSSELQQINLRQVKTRQQITLIGAGLLLVIAGLLYFGYKLKKKSNSALLRQQYEISEKNDALQLVVSEKDWLMREIHHRVKNNLHMVVGLLASQTEYVKGKEALDALNDSQHRIQAMSIIHQKLYQTDNLSSTDMADYILELTDYLQSSFNAPSVMRYSLDIEKVDFPLALSIPVGLIINEAVTNSMKYAFVDGRRGEIRIELKRQPSDEFCLVIHDNGVGIPHLSGLKKDASLGISLIKGLSDDIKGKLQIQNDHGLKIQITFPLLKTDEHHQ